jgi:2-polyprenyl-6-methoxyphenol hydroxylase-like FAD-dependent oxidoreductase
MRALVIGGSVGGLAAALELRSIGADVSVYERSVDRTQPRGAGIVMQPEVEDLLARLGVSVPSVSVQLQERQRLHHGGATDRYHAPQWMTAWDSLFRAFRTALGDGCYRLDSTLEQLAADDHQVVATFTDGHRAAGDVLVGADGVASTTRTLLGLPGDVTYSGYVAFRGLEPESELPADLVELLAERFTMFAVPGMQMLCYLVPGANGELGRGLRRVNWVWYINTPAAELPTLLTGTSGRQFENFLPPGELTPDNNAALAALAAEALPPQFAALVGHSSVFLQPVFDRPPARMVHGRAVLIGDAAGTVRPHTASGTSKALGDAAGLAHALADRVPGDDLPAARLEDFERRRLTHLVEVARHGVRLAAQSSLGVSGPEFLVSS